MRSNVKASASADTVALRLPDTCFRVDGSTNAARASVVTPLIRAVTVADRGSCGRESNHFDPHAAIPLAAVVSGFRRTDCGGGMIIRSGSVPSPRTVALSQLAASD